MAPTEMSPTSPPARAGAPLAPSFGALIGGVRLVLPAGVPVVYLADAAIHPLATPRRRVLGLMQLQGHPVVVLDPSVLASADSPALRRRAVLVLGSPGEGGALRVDEPPAAIALGEPLPGANRPECAFAQALRDPVADAADRSRVWWHFSPSRLFELLATADEVTT